MATAQTASPPRKNISIHPNKRRPGVAARRARNHARNKSFRADLYTKYEGQTDWQKGDAWHSALRALSSGTAG
jgi:hypothetical protein